MQQLPKFVRGRLARPNPGPHPDPDLLTAFAEQSLAGGQRGYVLEHLANCTECRDIVFMALPEAAAAQVVITPQRKSWIAALRWAAVACVVVVGAAVGIHYTHQAPQQSAKLRESVPAQAPAAQKVEAPAQPQVTAKLEPPVNAEIAARPQAKQAHAASSQNTDRLEKKSNADTPSVAARRDEAFANSPVPSAAPTAAPATTASNEAVEVSGDVAQAQPESKSAPEIAEAVPGKAKEPMRSSGAAMLAMKTGSFAKKAAANNRAVAGTPRWTLSSDGTLQRSFDSGASWQKVALPTSAVLRALAASASEIWVGGSAGALYHSADAGTHWTRIRPMTAGKSLTADVIGIEFADPQHGKVTTANQEIWTTADGGQNWQSQ